jgi:hypothetical protein
VVGVVEGGAGTVEGAWDEMAVDLVGARVAALPFDLLRNALLLGPGDKHAITEIVDQVFLPLVSR